MKVVVLALSALMLFFSAGASAQQVDTVSLSEIAECNFPSTPQDGVRCFRGLLTRNLTRDGRFVDRLTWRGIYDGLTTQYMILGDGQAAYDAATEEIAAAPQGSEAWGYRIRGNVAGAMLEDLDAQIRDYIVVDRLLPNTYHRQVCEILLYHHVGLANDVCTADRNAHPADACSASNYAVVLLQRGQAVAAAVEATRGLSLEPEDPIHSGDSSARDWECSSRLLFARGLARRSLADLSGEADLAEARTRDASFVHPIDEMFLEIYGLGASQAPLASRLSINAETEQLIRARVAEIEAAARD